MHIMEVVFTNQRSDELRLNEVIMNMEILVFSDSHGSTKSMKDIISKTENIDTIIHLGDLVKDAEEIKYTFENISVEYIAGNNDWYSDAQNEKILVLENKRIFLTHGNIYGVKNGYSNIGRRGQELGVDLVLFGHTHEPYGEYIKNMLLFNPGSIALPVRGSTPTYGVIKIANGEINSKIYRV